MLQEKNRDIDILIVSVAGAIVDAATEAYTSKQVLDVTALESAGAR